MLNCCKGKLSSHHENPAPHEEPARACAHQTLNPPSVNSLESCHNDTHNDRSQHDGAQQEVHKGSETHEEAEHQCRDRRGSQYENNVAEIAHVVLDSVLILHFTPPVG